MGRGAVTDVGTSDIHLMKVDLGEIKQKLDSLVNVTEALWELLQEKGGYSEDELKEIVAEITDKKTEMRKSKNECPSCGMKNNPKITKCMYCGAELTVNEEFKGVFSFNI
ncbi:MAG: zinc ribbon domain-containing protein [Gammaproteobacteria bacterium]|nr:MAG: zinc ribbon domain-containing protein [Gammaproteobacteria bacterium]